MCSGTTAPEPTLPPSMRAGLVQRPQYSTRSALGTWAASPALREEVPGEGHVSQALVDKLRGSLPCGGARTLTK